MAKENGTTVSAVYKRTVWTADNTGLREGNGGGGVWKAHRANLLDRICQIHVSLNFCTYVQELSLEETKLQT